jgi:dsDNA-specific endonuclease/ATPase MutS2
MFEPKVNELFTYKGKTYKVFHLDYNTCEFCDFENNLTSDDCKKFNCAACHRKDNLEVIFREVDIKDMIDYLNECIDDELNTYDDLKEQLQDIRDDMATVKDNVEAYLEEIDQWENAYDEVVDYE